MVVVARAAGCWLLAPVGGEVLAGALGAGGRAENKTTVVASGALLLLYYYAHHNSGRATAGRSQHT